MASSGFSCHPGQHPQGSSAQQGCAHGYIGIGEVSAGVVAELSGPFSSAHPACSEDSECRASQLEPHFTGKNGGMAERDMGRWMLEADLGNEFSVS